MALGNQASKPTNDSQPTNIYLQPPLNTFESSLVFKAM
jgi:hypothetical protein